MEKEQVHIPSTNSSVRILTTKQDPLSLQYIVELPNRKRNIISLRVIVVFAALLSLIWFKKIAIVVVSVSVVGMLYLELSNICKETVTVIKDTCITYSASTLLGRKQFQSVPINRLLGVALIENIVGSRVHGILNLIVRTGDKTSVQVPVFTALRPNLDTIVKMRHGILSYTEDAIKANIVNFGKGEVMMTNQAIQNKLTQQKQTLKQSFMEMKTKKNS